MAQTPATPKGRRRMLLWQLSLRGAQWLLDTARLQASERAALELHGVLARQAPQDVVFLIPLVGPHHVKDWDGVCARLNDTLQSLIRQSERDWTAVICGQQRPAALPDDPRIRFLPFTDKVEGNDKWRKLAQLYASLPELDTTAGYAMSFDADDLAHPDLVAEMLNGQSPGGYLVETGYVYDQSSDTLALAGPRRITKPLRKPFWKLCGSCAALRYDLRNGPAEIDFLREMSQHEHRMFPYLARLAGRSLTPLRRSSVLYLLNHGDNFGARRGRVSFKTRFVQRYCISDDADIRKIFGL